MTPFKFFKNTKRPILDSLFTEDELTLIDEYCVDICQGTNSDELLRYYPRIGIINKSFLDGELRRIGIHYYPFSDHNLARIHMEIDVRKEGIFYIFTVKYMEIKSTTGRIIEYPIMYEEF